MSEWITDRQPTAEDAVEQLVWVCIEGNVLLWGHDGVRLGTAWQPITQPAQYVKPKRWKVEWDCMTKHYVIRLNLRYIGSLPELCCDEIAQRIEDLFNEVMP